MKCYKIRRKSDGLYYSPYNKFTTQGKVWARLNYPRCVISHKPKLFQDCVIVEFDIVEVAELPIKGK